nr:undecaprenyl-diphosphate phosphatase [Angustibacter aerolatus]
MFFSPEHAAVSLDPLRRGRSAAGLAMDDFDVVPTVPVVIGPDVERAADPLRAHAALYVGGMGSRDQNFYNALARRMGFEAEAEQIQQPVPRPAPARRRRRRAHGLRRRDLVDRAARARPRPARRLRRGGRHDAVRHPVRPHPGGPLADPAHHGRGARRVGARRVSDLTYLHSVVLGVVEGLTEFLPVSSTGHLTVVEGLLGLPVDSKAITSFTAVIQARRDRGHAALLRPRHRTAGGGLGARAARQRAPRRPRLPARLVRDRRIGPGRDRRVPAARRHRRVAAQPLGGGGRAGAVERRAGGRRAARPAGGARRPRRHDQGRRDHRRRPVLRAGPGRLAIGRHDQRRPAARARPGHGDAAVVLPRHPDAHRRRAVRAQGRRHQRRRLRPGSPSAPASRSSSRWRRSPGCCASWRGTRSPCSCRTASPSASRSPCCSASAC